MYKYFIILKSKIMKSGIVLFIIVLSLLASSGCGLISKKYTKTATEQFQVTMSGKKKIKLDNIKGSIVISKSRDTNPRSYRGPCT